MHDPLEREDLLGSPTAYFPSNLGTSNQEIIQAYKHNIGNKVDQTPVAEMFPGYAQFKAKVLELRLCALDARVATVIMRDFGEAFWTCRPRSASVGRPEATEQRLEASITSQTAVVQYEGYEGTEQVVRNVDYYRKLVALEKFMKTVALLALNRRRLPGDWTVFHYVGFQKQEEKDGSQFESKAPAVEVTKVMSGLYPIGNSLVRKILSFVDLLPRAGEPAFYEDLDLFGEALRGELLPAQDGAEVSEGMAPELKVKSPELVELKEFIKKRMQDFVSDPKLDDGDGLDLSITTIIDLVQKKKEENQLRAKIKSRYMGRGFVLDALERRKKTLLPRLIDDEYESFKEAFSMMSNVSFCLLCASDACCDFRVDTPLMKVFCSFASLFLYGVISLVVGIPLSIYSLYQFDRACNFTDGGAIAAFRDANISRECLEQFPFERADDGSVPSNITAYGSEYIDFLSEASLYFLLSPMLLFIAFSVLMGMYGSSSAGTGNCSHFFQTRKQSRQMISAAHTLAASRPPRTGRRANTVAAGVEMLGRVRGEEPETPLLEGGASTTYGGNRV